jgi:hypothetical protein
MAMAGKLTVDQLRQSIQSGSLPAYIGIPMIEEKNKEKEQMAAAQQGFPEEQKSPSVTAQILQKAEQQEFPEEQQSMGIDQLPSNLPIQNEEDDENYAGGGIIAFSNGDQVDDPAKKRRGDATNFIKEYWASPEGRAMAAQARQMGEPSTSAPSKIVEEFYTIQSGNPKQGSINTAKAMGISPNGLRYMQNPNLDVLEQMRIEDPKGYESFMGGNTISPEFGGSSITPEQDAERVAKIKEDLGYDPSNVYDFLRPSPKTETTSPTRGSLTAGISPADVARTEAQLPRTGTPSPKAPPSTGKVANIPLTTGEMRSDVAAGSGSMLDQYAAMLMDERKGIAKDRQQAKAMAIFQAGLGIAGGTSPNPFANISQGALQGTQAYQQEMKGIRREDADRLKQLMSLGIGKEKLALEARKLGIEDKKIEGLLARYAAAGAGSEDAIITRRLNTAKSLFSDAMKANPFADEATQDAMWANAQRRAMIPGAGSSAEEPKNKYAGFSLEK